MYVNGNRASASAYPRQRVDRGTSMKRDEVNDGDDQGWVMMTRHGKKWTGINGFVDLGRPGERGRDGEV